MTQFPTIVVSELGADQVQTVNGRDLHTFMGVRRDFSTWIKDRIEQYGFAEHQDYEVFTDSGDNVRSPDLGSKRGGHNRVEYAISLDMAKELAMVENNEQGREVRRYFIRMERQAKNPALSLNDPATLRKLLLGSVDRVMQLEQAIEADKPKTSFYDEFVNADGLYNFQNAGRALECHPNLFIRWLKTKYVFHQGAALVPYVQYRQMGIFETKSEIHEGKARLRTFMTAKGLEYFAAKIPAEIKIGGRA